MADVSDQNSGKKEIIKNPIDQPLAVGKETVGMTAAGLPNLSEKNMTGPSVIVDKGRIAVGGGTIVAPATPDLLTLLPSMWSPRELTPDTVNTSHGPALAAFKEVLYLAYKGSGTDTNIWYSVYNGNSWSTPPTCFAQIDPGGYRRTTSDRPALALYGDKLYMAWKRSDDAQIWFSCTSNGLTWTIPKYTGGNSTHGPALAVFDEKLYMAWKGSADRFIWYAAYDGAEWIHKGNLNDYGVNTSHSPALATYKDGGREKLYLVWKGMDDDTRIWFTSMSMKITLANSSNGTHLSRKESWEPLGSIFPSDQGASCGPALATYSKYWKHSDSYDPIHKDLYMVWKSGNDSVVYQSAYRLKEWKEEWTQRSPIPSVRTLDTPALAVFKDKLYMAWKASSSTKVYFSHLDTGSDNYERNIFDKTRPGTPVVRQEDLAVLRIETRNMKIVSGPVIHVAKELITSHGEMAADIQTGKPQLQRTGDGDAYLILHFPPQSFGEEAFFQTKPPDDGFTDKPLDPPKPGGGTELCDPPVHARIAHESRLVFKVPDNFGSIEYTLAGVLEACKKLPLSVSTAERPQMPSATTTSIEMPWRLIISPDSGAYWRHAASPVTSDPTNYTELWHSQMVTPKFDGGKIVEEIMPPYPDDRRTTRALWALSGVGSEVAYDKLASTSNLSIVPMQSAFPGSAYLPAPDVNPFRMTLDNFDRYQLAHLTSNFKLEDDNGQPLYPEPLVTNTMMLSSLGGWLDLRGAWDTPGLSIEQWTHRATMGRDHFVRVVYRGFLFPFGHRVSLIKVSERKFNKTKTGADYAAYLHQRMYMVINEKERGYNGQDSLFEDTRNGSIRLASKFPFKSVKLLTEVTPDLDPPNSEDCSVDGNGQKMFWPHVGGKPFRFQCAATDLDGRRVLFDLPMIFVDSTLALPRGGENEPRLDYTNASKYAKIAADAYANKGSDCASFDNTAKLEFQRVALAKHKKPGDTSVQVNKMQFGGFARDALSNESLKKFSKDLTRPIWVPQVEYIDARIESIASLTGAQKTHMLMFNTEYLIHGLAGDASADNVNKGEVFVDIASGPNLDFSSQGNNSGGFIQPNIKPAALSRIAGPVMGNVPEFINGKMEDGAGFPVSDSDLSGLPLPLIFGCIPLGALIKGANISDLKRFPKFISEAGNKVDSFIGDLSRLYDFVAGVPKQAVSLVMGALTVFDETLQDIVEQAAAYAPAQMVPVVTAINLVKAKHGPAINHLSNLLNQPDLPNLNDLLAGIGHAGYSQAIEAMKNAAGASLPAGFKQSILNTAQKMGQLMAQLASLPTLANLGEALLGELYDIVGSPQNTATMLTKPAAALKEKLDSLKARIDSFNDELKRADLLDGAPRNAVSSALSAVLEILNSDITKLLEMLTGDELTVRFDWNPEIKSWSLDGSSDPKHQLFRANDKNGLLVTVEAKVKKNGASSPKIGVNCSLKHFDLVLIAPAGFIELNFEKIEFSVDSAAKPDVDVLLSNIKFLGVLSFVETLRDLIPLDGFSDPPYLDITSKGIDAGFGISLPSVCCGMLNIANLSLAAGFTVPFIGEPLSVRFNFCRREQPFLLTVYGLGGGGFFGITIDPHGVQILEASLEFGAALAIDFGVAKGEVHVMAGMYYRMEQDEASLSGYFRMGGSLSVLGLITASVELYLELRYEFSTGKCVGKAQLTIHVSVLFFSTNVTISAERKIAGSNGDPTFRQMLGYQPDMPGYRSDLALNEELDLIDERTEYPWRDYLEAFAYEEVY